MPLTKSKKGTGSREDSPGPSKRDRYSSDEEEDPVPRKGKCYSSSKMSKQGVNKKNPVFVSKQSSGHQNHNKPAELFRKDLISAMKLADTDILHENDYLVICDPWRQEWEKGVQVPVNEEEIPPLTIQKIEEKEKIEDHKMPPRRYLHEKNDETYQASQHELTRMQELSEQIVRYDLDDQDVVWLELVNEDREEMGLQLINEWNLERMIEELENQCYAKTNTVKKTEEGLGIEYDEDVACDVCRMLESEDTNEMVFCDGCDICVHQACYGIQTIPEGSWLCRICALGIKPMCLLCPKRGGAMKSTRSGTKWTHVSCALWIPEVSIGDAEKMEPITKISNIPTSRWALVCCLCKERVGACIQCSVKQCKTAFHVTCGFAHNLDMKTVLDDTDELDGIHLRAYCPKHTKNRNASDSESPKKEDEENAESENDISEDEMVRQRMEKLQQLEEEFYMLVDITDVATKFFIPEEAVSIVMEYWKMKRKVNGNKPLITPKMEEEDQMQKQQKDSLSARMKMFVHLRQDLERARNLCYMISRREKTKRQLLKLKESVFKSQFRVLTDQNLNLSAREAEKVRQEYHFQSIYSHCLTDSAQSGKLPRENLFTLENLKTPKDYAEGWGSGGVDASERSHSPCPGSAKAVVVKSENRADGRKYESTASMDSAPVSVKSEDGSWSKEKLFSLKNVGVVSDSNADSSDDERVMGEPITHTDSTHMSRLGKAKPEEIEEGSVQSERHKQDNSPKAKKFVATSDLRKKLTSILQSKSMMQQRKGSKKLEGPALDELHVDVENSDSEMFTSDTNTDLTSLSVDTSRNLFDKFRMQEKTVITSPDIHCDAKEKSHQSYSRRQHKKVKRRKHSHSSHKHRKSHLFSSSEQSSASSVSIKQEIVTPRDADFELAEHTGQVMSDVREHDRLSVQSPTLPTDVSDTEHRRHRSPSKSSKSKKKSRKDRSSSSSPNKSLRSSNRQHNPLSPSPRVHPHEIYGTVDGDIYVPSGKIQVTERTIFFGNTSEGHSRVRSKLRLKKQSHSPVKGVVSYEVVKEDDDVRLDDFKEEKLKENAQSDIFDRLCDDPSSLQNLENPEQSPVKEVDPEATAPKLRNLRKHKSAELSGLQTKNGKSSSKDDNTSADIKIGVEGSLESPKDKKDIVPVDSGKEKSMSTVAVKITDSGVCAGNSLDENFIPKVSSCSIGDEIPTRTRRHRTSRPVSGQEVDNEDKSGDIPVNPPAHSICHNENPGQEVILKPLPNRPDLAACFDSNALVVKEPFKRQVNAQLYRFLQKGGDRWVRANRIVSKDKFVERTNCRENVFSRMNMHEQQNKRLAMSSGRSDLHPLQTKSSSLNATIGSTEQFPTSPIKGAESAIFGTPSSPKNSLNTHRVSKKTVIVSSGPDISPSIKNTEGPVFGAAEKLQSPEMNRQLSFEEVGKGKSELLQVVKTSSKCDPAELTEDRLDGSRSYRSQSPASSEGSIASSRFYHVDSTSGELTPSKRLTRSQVTEDSPTSRLRKRESLLKPSQLKL